MGGYVSLFPTVTFMPVIVGVRLPILPIAVRMAKHRNLCLIYCTATRAYALFLACCCLGRLFCYRPFAESMIDLRQHDSNRQLFSAAGAISIPRIAFRRTGSRFISTHFRLTSMVVRIQRTISSSTNFTQCLTLASGFPTTVGCRILFRTAHRALMPMVCSICCPRTAVGMVGYGTIHRFTFDFGRGQFPVRS